MAQWGPRWAEFGKECTAGEAMVKMALYRITFQRQLGIAGRAAQTNAGARRRQRGATFAAPKLGSFAGGGQGWQGVATGKAGFGRGGRRRTVWVGGRWTIRRIFEKV